MANLDKHQIEKMSWKDVYLFAGALATNILNKLGKKSIRIFGVPRGGVYVVQAVKYHSSDFVIVEEADDADVIIDDLVDCGATRASYLAKFPNKPFATLIPDPMNNCPRYGWLEFPWERANNEAPAEDNVRRIIEAIGDDPKREGLLETPKRVTKSWGELYSGYKADPSTILKTFTDGACDEMVVLNNIEFYSNCEHHMQPFFGQAHIGYIPNGKVVGISKLARLLEVYSRRLQIQERIGMQITTAIMEQLGAKGAGCVLQAKHFCMCSRGVNKQSSMMVTSSLRGVFTEPAPRSEFLRLAGL